MRRWRSPSDRRFAPPLIAVLVLAALVVPASSSNAAGCALTPHLRDVTTNQGLGSYTLLARGKPTLVRLYLSLPACAASGASIALTSASLTANNTVTNVIIMPFAPTQGPAPNLVAYSAAPAQDAVADPRFVIPATFLAPAANTNRYTLTLSATVIYLAKTSATDPGTAGSATFTGLSATPTTPITATVEKRTNALRILVVPMGDATQSFATWFDDTAKATTQKAMTALSRIFPIPDGTADLTTPSGGLRYSIAPTLLNVRSLLDTATRKFCGTATNFSTLKVLMGQFLASWNTLNPGANADRVLGVVADTRSLGSASGCNEGYAGINTNVAWVRAVAGVSGSPSPTGALAAMELAHTMGAVPSGGGSNPEYDLFSPYHSKNTAADATALHRAYNLTTRSYLGTNRTAMRLTDTWNQTDTVLEPTDWAYLLCVMGGAPATYCATPGTVGTSTGVGANLTFVLTGDSDGTAAGTNVVESYFATDVASTAPDPTSAYRLIQRDATNAVLHDDGVPFSNVDSNHGTSGPPSPDSFSVAFHFNTATARVELWKGEPPGGVLLYTRARTGAPSINGVTIGAPNVTTERVSLDSSGAQANGASSKPKLSANGRFVLFGSSATNLVPGDTNGFDDVFLLDRQSGAVERVSVSSTGGQGDGPTGPGGVDVTGDGNLVVFQSSATNLVAGDTNGQPDIFLRDRRANTTQRISVGAGGVEANNRSDNAKITRDGRYVVFQSQADNLVPGDTNTSSDIFVRDLRLGTTTRVSVDSAGGQSNLHSNNPAISPDGRFVAFGSVASNLVPGDTNGFNDVFVHDRDADHNGIFDEPGGTITERVSVSSGGAQGNADSGPTPTTKMSISNDGRYVSFDSAASNLVAGDTNGFSDVFVATVSKARPSGSTWTPRGTRATTSARARS